MLDRNTPMICLAVHRLFLKLQRPHLLCRQRRRSLGLDQHLGGRAAVASSSPNGIVPYRAAEAATKTTTVPLHSRPHGTQPRFDNASGFVMTSPTVTRWSLVAPAFLAMLGGCTADMSYPTIQDLKDFARMEREALVELDARMTRQHMVMSPEPDEELLRLAAESETKRSEMREQTRAIRESLSVATARLDVFERLHSKRGSDLNSVGSRIAQLEQESQHLDDSFVRLRDVVDATLADKLASFDRDLRASLAELDESLTDMLEKQVDGLAELREEQKQIRSKTATLPIDMALLRSVGPLASRHTLRIAVIAVIIFGSFSVATHLGKRIVSSRKSKLNDR